MCTNKLFQVTAAHSYTHPFNGCFPGLLRRAGTRKIKPIWILLKQATVASAGHMQVCNSLQTDNHTSTPPLSFVQALPAAQPTASKH